MVRAGAVVLAGGVVLVVIAIVLLMHTGGSVGGSVSRAATPAATNREIRVDCGPDGARQPKIAVAARGHAVEICAPAQSAATPASDGGENR